MDGPDRVVTLIDARKLPAGHRIESDLCIVGSGAAGLALATALEGSARRVALLESGGLEADATTTALNAGEIVGLADFPLDQSRLRFFGGTTNHWTAWVRPLEPIDFERRSWVPHSGWPFGIDELEPHYERARTFLGLPERSFEVPAWSDDDRRPWQFEGGRVESRVLQIVPPERRSLGPLARQALERSSNVDVYLHANALELVPDEAVKRVEEVRIAVDARRLSARARSYVLAAGGIENARLLLLSSSIAPAGLGNAHDLVGRYFANHPESGRAAVVLLTDSRATPGFYAGGAHATGVFKGFLRLREEVQREAELPNCWFQPISMGRKRRSLLNLDDAVRTVRRWRSRTQEFDLHVAQASAELDRAVLAQRPGTGRATRRVPLKAVIEPIPNPSSRVRLGEERDAFGQRKVVLDWRLSERDSKNLHATLTLLAREVGASGLGRVQVRFPPAGFEAVDHRGSFHHMGTTRMHTDPAQGVVDANGRVHGLANLFVAGSSLFPTFGTANPTFTLLALTFRLADHLRSIE